MATQHKPKIFGPTMDRNAALAFKRKQTTSLINHYRKMGYELVGEVNSGEIVFEDGGNYFSVKLTVKSSGFDPNSCAPINEKYEIF